MRRLFALLLVFAINCSADFRKNTVSPSELAAWPPEQRVAYLMKNGFHNELGHLLLATGTDAVHALVQAIRHGSSWDAVHALRTLCDMDRYVPASAASLPDFAIRIKVPSLQIAGRINTAVNVDGRRIGPEGLSVLQWASHESSDKMLRTTAQICTGEMHDRLAAMSFSDLLPLWEKLIKSCFHLEPCASDSADRAALGVLDQVLSERAPESLDALAEVLKTTSHGWVILSAAEVLGTVDITRFRVAQNESGKRLIAAVSAKLDPGNPARLFPQGLLQAGFTQEHELQVRHEQQASLNSLLSLAPRYIPSIVAFLAYAHLQHAPNPVWERDPQIRAFVLYLSASHPDFLSWEYVAASVDEEILNSRFQLKMRRFMQEWEKFKQMQTGKKPMQLPVGVPGI